MGTAIRKVTVLGHPVLRAPTRDLSPKEIQAPEVRRLIAEMEASMLEYAGVGIAANQAGEGLSLFLMGLEPGGSRHPAGIELAMVFNPKLKLLGQETTEDWEGCLSVPGLRGKVRRHLKVELSGLDQDAKPFRRLYEGFPARVVQHECDHLAGKVYLDRMADLTTLCYT
ncbi:MAG: peptide deformylase [Elusimicrobia bacterium]|nr:peptide deformylase [Elusimicrobiota bacterium]